MFFFLLLLVVVLSSGSVFLVFNSPISTPKLWSKEKKELNYFSKQRSNSHSIETNAFNEMKSDKKKLKWKREQTMDFVMKEKQVYESNGKVQNSRLNIFNIQHVLEHKSLSLLYHFSCRKRSGQGSLSKLNSSIHNFRLIVYRSLCVVAAINLIPNQIIIIWIISIPIVLIHF